MVDMFNKMSSHIGLKISSFSDDSIGFAYGKRNVSALKKKNFIWIDITKKTVQFNGSFDQRIKYQ